MSKTIKPLDGSLTTPQALSDRSALSELYGKSLEDISKLSQATIKTGKTIDTKSNLVSGKVQWKLAIIVNLLLALPFVISYISISKIYTLVGPNTVFDAASNQLLMTSLTICTFVPWIVSLRYLSKLANSHDINLSALLVSYCFFAFPALDALVSLHLHMSVWVLLSLVIIFSQAYTQIMITALLSSKTGFLRFRLLLIAIFVICSVAIII
jgi:hypothetical protein